MVQILPRHWILLAVLVGILAGIGGHTFRYARGFSYMLDDPTVCINCHIMNDQFASWLNSSHQGVATCNDCHVPVGFPHNYIAKAINGYHHSVGFTFQPARPDDPDREPFFNEPIMIKERNLRILLNNCLRCHGDFVHDVLPAGAVVAELRCVECHRSVGHGARR
jgi:cytochrome c nitrite reductase small subunit